MVCKALLYVLAGWDPTISIYSSVITALQAGLPPPPSLINDHTMPPISRELFLKGLSHLLSLLFNSFLSFVISVMALNQTHDGRVPSPGHFSAIQLPFYSLTELMESDLMYMTLYDIEGHIYD